MERLLAICLAGSLAAGCTCAYGGPGCSDPALGGLCSAQLPLGETTATVNYGDDTGYHPSEVGRVTAVPEDRMTATLGEVTGELVLVGLDEGPAEFRISRVAGWEDSAVFFFRVDVVAAPAVTDCVLEDSFLLPDEQ
ncbi:MAG: hypothetical protein ABI867_20805 [Kofleriaceae bacterium]